MDPNVKAIELQDSPLKALDTRIQKKGMLERNFVPPWLCVLSSQAHH